MRCLRQTCLALIVVLASVLPALAFNPDEVLADPALEARARAISLELRCLVCQNQSIDDSNAQLAHDLRLLVRDRLKAGDSDEDVINYVVSRYGEFVLLKPRLSMKTLILWSAPVVILLLGAGAMIIFSRGRARAVSAAGAELSEAEQAELAKLLAEHDRQT